MRWLTLMFLAACGGAAPSKESETRATEAPAGKRRAAEDRRSSLEQLGYMADDDDHLSARPAKAPSPAPAVIDRPEMVVPTAPALRAGKTDDNADFNAFLTFLGTWTDRRLGGQYQRVDVHGRTWVQVLDADGHALPDATVTFATPSHGSRTTRTYGDGRAQVFPYVDGSTSPSGEIEVAWHGTRKRIPWSGDDLEVRLNVHPAAEPAVPVDVAILLDTTGSMSDEIQRIKDTLTSVTERLGALDRPVDLRLGAVFYRDLGDDYVTRTQPFTADLSAFQRALAPIAAGGGGDTPEAMNEALEVAIRDLQWRPDAAHVAFLVADAPPHMDRQAAPYGTSALAAAARGIRLHSVAASGLDAVGSLIFRQTAQITRGQFIFIEYGDVAAAGRSHGVASAEQIGSNNLDSILFDQIQAEISGWRR